jgi:hypothetical protein
VKEGSTEVEGERKNAVMELRKEGCGELKSAVKELRRGVWRSRAPL